MNQTTKDRVLKLVQVACYAAFVVYLITCWKDILELVAEGVSRALVLGLLLAALAALAMLLVALFFITEKVLKAFTRHG